MIVLFPNKYVVALRHDTGNHGDNYWRSSNTTTLGGGMIAAIGDHHDHHTFIGIQPYKNGSPQPFTSGGSNHVEFHNAWMWHLGAHDSYIYYVL